MTVKEYANKMGLTVNGLCEVTGMSRMGLNNILVKGCRAEHLWKRREAVDRLCNFPERRESDYMAGADTQ